MNDRNNLDRADGAQDSVEARLARAAQQLDSAAANYAYRANNDAVPSASASSGSASSGSTLVNRATPRRRFSPFAAIGGAVALAGTLLFGASVISNQAEKPPESEPIEVAAPSTQALPVSDFPFIGEILLSLPTPSLEGQPEVLRFRNGVAISSVDQSRLTLASAIDIDLDADGQKELAVLINRDVAASDATPTIPDLKTTKSADLSKKSPSKIAQPSLKSNPKALDSAPRSTSAVAVVRIVKGEAQTLATTPAFDVRLDTLLMNRKSLWTMRTLDNALRDSGLADSGQADTGLADSGQQDSGQAVLQRALVNTDTHLITWAPAEQPIARTVLPLIVEGDKQIRFIPGTTSALVFAAAGTRTGWFTAKAGQTLTIGTIGIPSSKKRQIAIRLRTGSNDQTLVSSGLLPASLTTVLPHGGDYEILISEETAETTFELSIQSM